MFSLITFILICYGITNIVTQGLIFEPVRSYIELRHYHLGQWIRCPMCFGFWVGIGISLLWPVTNPFFDGCIASGSSWLLYVWTIYMGGDEL